MTHLVAQLTRARTSLLAFKSKNSTLTVSSIAQASVPSLTERGWPNKAAGPVLSELLAEAGGPSGEVTILLPPGTANLTRLVVEEPVGGKVTQDIVARTIARAEAAVREPDRALLACRPVGYRADGEEGRGDPVGLTVNRLTVEIASLSADLSLLSAFDRVVGEVGLGLAGVISAPEAAIAAFLPDGEGSGIVVGWPDTLAVEARGGAVYAAAHVALGRRHLESDLVRGLSLGPSDAEARLSRVLEGRADAEAEPVVRARLSELEELLGRACGVAGLTLNGPVITGLPPRAIRGASGGAPPLPAGLEDLPLLAGAGYLVTGLRGQRDRASASLTAAPRQPGLLGWLRDRF